MNRKSTKLFKILVSLFALNSFSLYLYFSHSHHRNHLPQTANHRVTDDNQLLHNHNQHHFSKAWPIIPSYLPWWQSNNDVRYPSCEAYFGNGFNKRLDLLPSPAATASRGSGWFRCYYSETLRSSICEGGKVKMDNEKIKMSKGGEKLEDVMGRGDEEELPVFESGAFQVEGDGKSSGSKGRRRNRREGKRLVSDEVLDRYVPQGEILKHTMRELIGSIRVVDPEEFEDCEQWVEEPTLLVTRYEYANLFHTMADWYNAYISSRVTGLPNRPHVVFVDGHCKTQLEETWEAMFSSIKYAKNFSGPVCFRHAVISPLGYENVLFKGLNEDVDCHRASSHDLWQNPDNRKTARLSEFGEMIRAAFGFEVNRHSIEKPTSGQNILFVQREDYLAHPRHGGKVESRLSNEQEVFDSVKSWASNFLECKVNIVNGLFAHMSMREQIRAIQDASLVIGAHGAGLTHIVSATPKTVILEIVSGQFRRPHF